MGWTAKVVVPRAGRVGAVWRWEHVGSGSKGLLARLRPVMHFEPTMLGQQLGPARDGPGSVALWCGLLGPPPGLLVQLLPALREFVAMELTHFPLPQWSPWLPY
ncbi:hypothetical protein ACFX16_009617 [Malus domestica]